MASSVTSQSDLEDDAYDSDELPELQLDLPKLMQRASETLSATCIDAKRITRGYHHEIFLLSFSPTDEVLRSPCIARFARLNDATTAAKEESEIATIMHLEAKTSIPVPRILHYDTDISNDIGAAYVLMEKLPGNHLYDIWDELPLPHKRKALSDIAAIITQFALLQYNSIGALELHGPQLGPVFSLCYDLPQGPFHSTEKFLHSFVNPASAQLPELQQAYQAIQAEISAYLSSQDAHFFKAPFTFLHADFDAQNMLFTQSPEGPQLSGLIDFEFSFTGPLYFLYEYPIFIQDVDSEVDRYAENKSLRRHFIRQIFDRLPSREAKAVFIACMNAKSFTLNRFSECFMLLKCSEKTLLNSSKYYLESLRDGTGRAYSGRIDYTPELYSEEGEPLPDATNGAGPA